MADTTFVSKVTHIVATWLNDVNIAVYRAIGAGGLAPITPTEVVTNLGLNQGSRTTNVKSLLDFCSAAKITTILAGTQTDVTTELQACVDAVSPVNGSGLLAGTVVLPDNSKLLITATLDCTNSRTGVTLIRDGLRIEGNGVILTGATALDKKAIIECTGSQFFTIERGITLDSTLAPSNHSTIGLQQALSSTLPQTQNQWIGCRITMHSDPTANANVGTVAVWNFGAEENTYDTIYWNADCGIVLTKFNNGTQPGPATLTSYQTLDTTHTLGMTTFSGECAIINKSRANAPMILQDVTGVKADNLFLAHDAGAAGANAYAMKFLANASAIDMNVHIEAFSTIFVGAVIITSKMKIIVGGVTAGFENYAVLALDRTVAAGLLLSDFTVDRQSLNGIGAPGAPILSTADLNEATATSAYVTGCNITARALGSSNLYLPANVAANSGSVGLFGSNSGQPSDPTFAAGLSADTAAITGDGTIVDLDTIAWAAGGGFSRTTSGFDTASGKFYCLVPGEFTFDVTLTLKDVAAGHTIAQMWLVHSTGTQLYLLDQMNPSGALVDIAGTKYITLKGSVTLVMTYLSYVLLRISVGGSPKSVIVKQGGTGVNWITRFQGRSIRSI